VKVLLLHQHFKTPYTGGAVRSYYLAKALVDQGVSVSVVTGYNGRVEKLDMIDGIEVHFVPVSYDNSFGFYKRSVSFLKYVWYAIKLSHRFKTFDFCYAISVPLTVGIAARFIKRKYGIPYIFEVGDLWPDAPIQMGFIKNRVFQNLLFDLEGSIYKSAHSLVALSIEIQKALANKVNGKTIHLIPNMADTGFFVPEPKDPSVEKKYGAQGKFVVSYIGAIGLANGLEHFVDCAAKSEKAGLPVHFLLCGDGGVLPTIQTKVEALKLQNFSIIPFQSRAGVKEILNVTDASFVSYKPVPVLETGSPNKYFDALASGKLIIVNFGGWIRKEIEEDRCGVYIDQRSPEDFVSKLRPFVEERKLLKEYQQRARTLAEEKYSRHQLGQQFCEIFKETRS
jgi:glycosyltransferase involved in cell wall biosynthesis